MASFTPSLTSGVSMKPERRMTRLIPSPRDDLDPVCIVDARFFERRNGNQQEALVQDAVVLEVMDERDWHADGRGGQERCRARQPHGRVFMKAAQESFLGLPQATTRSLHKLHARAPRHHDKSDADGQEQREPPTLEQLEHVSAEED